MEGVAPDESLMSLDDVRDFLHIAVRACERFAAGTKVQLEILDKTKPDEEWLDVSQEEAAKGSIFFGNQVLPCRFALKFDRSIALHCARHCMAHVVDAERKGW